MPPITTKTKDAHIHSAKFGLEYTMLASTLQCLAVNRNACTHSAVFDPSLAPAGKAVVHAYYAGQYTYTISFRAVVCLLRGSVYI
jgi:hypothetical protein